MISKAKAQEVIDAIRTVCNEHSVVIYGFSINEGQHAEIAIESSVDFDADDDRNKALDEYGLAYIYASSIGDDTKKKRKIK